MFKKFTISILPLIFTLLFSSVVFGQDSSSSIDKNELNSGIVIVNYKSPKDTITKVMISKGNINYTYDLKSKDRFPLQHGEGDYTISVLENVEGKKYRVIEEQTVTLNLANKNEVFLQSIQTIKWDNNMNSIRKAKELTANAKNDEEKVNAIYKYIINNVKYDYDKVNYINADYIPSIEETQKSLKGICYDYSALFAAMLRSVDIPTKLVMGYKNDINEFHAWNQVYLKDANQWVIIDTTYDSIKAKDKSSKSMIKNASDYSALKQF